MYLKYIEIQGFKSFAKKIKFEFHDGITGIVGPNGSGKSNVADAVRWVLGEQKIKQLRGSKMEDVIFAGTANRKPQGYAYVSIIFDNSDHKLKIDFDEVTISRRLYRSGESEYMINGNVCRLRDINELFYDTGIGKDGYSIIGQGQIDKILQGKPDERRELFDEAAGIVKYKKRKNIAIRKLENEQQSLTRINDILSELGRRVGPLKRQSEAALKFVEYRDELKKFDINLFLCETGDLRHRIKTLEGKEKIVREDLEESRNIFDETKEGYEKISEDIVRLENDIASAKEKKSQAEVDRQSLLGRIDVLKEQINSSREALKLKDERISSLSEVIEQTKIKLDENNEKLVQTGDAAVKSESDISAQEQKVLEIQNENEELRLGIESMKEDLVLLTGKKGEISARIERLLATVEQMKSRREALEKDIEKYGADRKAQEARAKELKDELTALGEEISALKTDVSNGNAAFSQLNTDIRNTGKEIDAVNASFISASSRLDSLKTVAEQYEGYAGSIREVMKFKAKTPGILGVVADLIHVDKRYETAIETALGGNIQNVVTDNENTARETIEYLKKNKLGRATFLPLKAVTGRGEFRTPDVLKEKGVLGLASSLVSSDEKYRRIVNFLLGRIIVADNINNALIIARKYNYSLIIVTLEGEQLNRGGSLTGGAFRRKSNFLGRKREIDELEKSVTQLKAQKDELEEKLKTSMNQRDALERDITGKKDELNEKTIYLNTVKVNFEQAEDKSSELADDFGRVSEEKKNIDDQTGTFESSMASLDAELKANENENESLKEKIAEAESALADKRAAEAAEIMKTQQLKMEHSRLAEHSSTLIDTSIRLENEIKAAADEYENLKNSTARSEREVEERLKEITKIELEIEDVDKISEDLKTQLESLEAVRESQAGSHKNFIDQREEYSARMANLDKELYRLSSSREKLEEQLENRSAQIWNEYEMTYNMALESRDDELTDVKLMRVRIAELKSAIRGLGNINVGAIEEYKEVSERYEFLKTQHDDLIKAENDLNKIIKNLDKEMRDRFGAEFKKISKEFEKVFKEMFGGGTGSIELEEDVDVLDAGIRIIAQPPGKKLQNMMQLSGGEKALTAIAVLFAIQNLKPSPFCILDEIEAALDDSNIGRFSSYLKKLSADIQFIVITHRKGTMESCDRLYGITMQEKGVSTLVSVNLSDFEAEGA